MEDMRFIKIILTTILALAFMACGGDSKPAEPIDTLKAYHLAVRKKDATTMKLLLSEASLKIHQQEAQAQGLTLDDVVLRDTLFPADQKSFKYKPGVIEGDKATVEVENSFGGYDTIHLVREDGLWKIDKKATGDQMIQEVDDPINDLEEKINQDRKDIDDSVNTESSPSPDASPSVSPGNPTDPNATPSPSPNNDPTSPTPAAEPTWSPMP